MLSVYWEVFRNLGGYARLMDVPQGPDGSECCSHAVSCCMPYREEVLECSGGSFITFSAGLPSEDSALGSGGWKLCGLTPFEILHRSGGMTGRRGSLVAEGRHRFATRHRCSLARLFCAAFTLFLSQNAHESTNEVCVFTCMCAQ